MFSSEAAPTRMEGRRRRERIQINPRPILKCICDMNGKFPQVNWDRDKCNVKLCFFVASIIKTIVLSNPICLFNSDVGELEFESEANGKALLIHWSFDISFWRNDGHHEQWHVQIFHYWQN